MYVAAEGGGRVIGDTEGNYREREILLPGVCGETRGAAFEGEMTRAEGTGAFGENGEDTAGGEKFMAEIHGSGVRGTVAGVLLRIFIADDGNACEEEAGEEIFAELGGNEERGGGEDGFVNPAVDGTVAVKCDEERGASEARSGREDLDAREINASAEPGEELVPEVRHGGKFTMGEEEGGAGVWERCLKLRWRIGESGGLRGLGGVW